jgi:hypothetical protein
MPAGAHEALARRDLEILDADRICVIAVLRHCRRRLARIEVGRVKKL